TARHQTSEEPILPDGLFAFLSSGQRAGMSPPVALRLPGLQILGHLLAEGTSMPQSYRRQS
ncbi:hypothetical protein, partial [Klebsiella pneumoniae]|uniref:hypothetical protein n=2 Tax=Klebsiella pneumoniae TaxID=573 RepID=UPI001BAF5A5E